MVTPIKKVSIVVGTVFQDAGEATRALEIAKGIREYAPAAGIEPRIIFLSRGSRFEQRVIEAGFEIYHAEPKMSGIGLHQDLKMGPGEFVGEKPIALALIRGEIKAYEDIKPDLVLYGFWPIGGIARRMIPKEIPGICFVPLPLTEAFPDTISDVPEQIKLLAKLPFKVRIGIFRSIPKFIKLRIPLLRHSKIQEAARELGWKGEPLLNIFAMLRPNLLLVNDLPDYYDTRLFPEHVVFTGPLFSRAGAEDVGPEIREVFHPDNRKVKVFCTLGSSGNKKQLLEIIKLFTHGPGRDWNAVILSPSSICPIEEARAALGNRDGLYVTDSFIPAQKINALADIVICHGGQGTVQTAIASGTPLVGVAFQPEQQMNLDHVVSYGAAIRVPFDKWTAENIGKAVLQILSDGKYNENAQKLKNRMAVMDGKMKSAEAILGKIRELIG
jgi:UDP:flavonoid glycosyltransferase YjiC (YdhE family)